MIRYTNTVELSTSSAEAYSTKTGVHATHHEGPKDDGSRPRPRQYHLGLHCSPSNTGTVVTLPLRRTARVSPGFARYPSSTPARCEVTLLLHTTAVLRIASLLRTQALPLVCMFKSTIIVHRRIPNVELLCFDHTPIWISC